MKARVLLVLALAGASPLAAQSAPQTGEALSVHPQAREAIDGIKSPYCPGLMLEVCPSPGAALLRDSIQARAVRGMTSEAIIDGVLAEYGERWRAEPRTSGTGLWAWVIPPVVLLVGLGMVGVVLSRRRPSRPPVPEVDPDPEEEARLRDALRVLDEEEEPVF